jgi:hypothetical protein
MGDNDELRTTRTVMKSKLLAAVILLSVSAPSFAADQDARPHRRHAAQDEIYLHNYGPPDFYPGTTIPPDRVVYPVTGQPYGIYDGFDRHCGQSSANYRGQDGRRYPCN